MSLPAGRVGNNAHESRQWPVSHHAASTRSLGADETSRVWGDMHAVTSQTAVRANAVWFKQQCVIGTCLSLQDFVLYDPRCESV